MNSVGLLNLRPVFQAVFISERICLMNKVFNFVLLLILPGITQALEIGEKPPACTATVMASQQKFDVSDYKGKVVLLDFWATWCSPCKKSMPFFNSLQQEYQQKGLQIVAINVDENPDDTRTFLQQFPVNYVVVLDSEGDCPEKYQVKAMPSSYFIDRRGIIRQIHLGFRDRDKAEIRQLLEELLDENE